MTLVEVNIFNKKKQKRFVTVSMSHHIIVPSCKCKFQEICFLCVYVVLHFHRLFLCKNLLRQSSGYNSWRMFLKFANWLMKYWPLILRFCHISDGHFSCVDDFCEICFLCEFAPSDTFCCKKILKQVRILFCKWNFVFYTTSLFCIVNLIFLLMNLLFFQCSVSVYLTAVIWLAHHLAESFFVFPVPLKNLSYTICWSRPRAAVQAVMWCVV